MTEAASATRDIHPSAMLPKDMETKVWRYMDWWKFEDLIKNKRLHFCRADKLEDCFEGTYSRDQLLEMNKWLNKKGYADAIAQEENRRKINRKSFYISSWCMSDHDFDLMWKAYTSDNHAVAIQSTVEKLKTVCDTAIDHWPIDVSTVRYIKHSEGESINYLDGFEAFIHKDIHFKLDREIRIIIHPTFTGPTWEEVFLPVDLSILVERVILAPNASSIQAETVRDITDKAELTEMPVVSSRYDRPLME